MTAKYIPRSLEPVLTRAAKEFPVIVLTGPRQSGKTTLLKRLFGEKCRYISMELPDVQITASSDPRGFLDMNHSPVIFDEIQYVPNLLPYIKERVDEQRYKTGQYFLTGSQNLLLMKGVTESLAGRAAILRLLPLSWRELSGFPQYPLPWEGGRHTARKKLPIRKLWAGFLRGGYPELNAYPARDISMWHASYVQTYLERDVRMLKQIGDFIQFQSFLRALAARSAQLLNQTELARDLGVAVNTVKAWLSVLEATWQIVVLRPYFANVGKRLVKTPKIYFTDVGTLCHLVGLRDPDHAALSPMAGAIMETAVVTELIKTYVHRGIEPQIYFWRTAAGTEVDFIVEDGGKLIPIEVKLSSTPNPRMANAITVFRRDFSKKAMRGYVVHPGDAKLPLGKDATALPFIEL